MTKKQILRCIAFIVVVFMTIVLMCDLFEYENNKNFDKNANTYRNLPENILDGVYIGTSGADRYWIAPKAYEEYGMSIHALSFDALPSWLYTDIIDTALKNQTPKLVLLDARAFYQDNTADLMDVRARRAIDAQPFLSPTRWKMARKTVKYIHEQSLRDIEKAKLKAEAQTDPTLPAVVIPEERSKYDFSFAFPFIKFHSKWSDNYSVYNNLGSKNQMYGGFYMSPDRTIRKTPHARVVYDPNVYADLDLLAEESLYEVIDYIKEKNLNVLFVDTPQFLEGSELGRANTTYKILKENGLDYIHFYKNGSGEFTIDLDNTQEFYDESHVNYYGAVKFTDVLAKYIDENYDLPDRRKDEAAASYWDGKYQSVVDGIARYEQEKAAKEQAKLLAAQQKAQEEAAEQAAIQQIIDAEKKGGQ